MDMEGSEMVASGEGTDTTLELETSPVEEHETDKNEKEEGAGEDLSLASSVGLAELRAETDLLRSLYVEVRDSLPPSHPPSQDDLSPADFGLDGSVRGYWG